MGNTSTKSEVVVAPLKKDAPETVEIPPGGEGIQVPVDEEGFVKSFEPDQVDEYKAFFEEYGFVVVNNVISQDQANATVDEIWTDIINYSPGVERDKPYTWDSGWPSSKIGLLSSKVAKGPCAWNNRQNPNIYQIFKNLMHIEELMVSVDRYGIMRPTRNINMSPDPETDPKFEDKPTWSGPKVWFHWDLNPWIYSGLLPAPSPSKKESELPPELQDPWFRADISFITENNDLVEQDGWERMQGLLALEDSLENTGGFQTVPAFHREMADWAKANPSTKTEGFISVPASDPLIRRRQKITMRKGSFVVWSSQMPHCNYPNESDGFRLCQYIKMFPARVVSRPESRRMVLKMRLPEGFEVSTLGQKLFGLEEGSASEEVKTEEE